MMTFTLDNLAKIIADRFKIDPAKVVPEATLEELGFDSLSMVDLAVLLEKKTNTRISDQKLNEIANVADILAVFNGSLVAASASA